MAPGERSIDILHVITSLETGGAQSMLRRLLETLDGERFTQRVVSLVDGGPEADALLERGVEVSGLGMRPGVPDPRAVLALRRDLTRRRPALLMTWLYHADLVGTLAARLAGVRALVWNLRCTHQPGQKGSLSARMAPRLCARLSRLPRVIVTNSERARETHAALGYRPRRWEWIPNGFDLEALRPDPAAGARLRAELGLEAEHVLAGHVGRFHPMKNHAGLLEAVGRLAAGHPELRLVLVGAGVEPENPAFEELVVASGAADRVHALGERRDVGALLPGMDFLVSASRSTEGFPNVLGEALACGLPCVTTDVGDSRAIVGEAGVVAPGVDVQGLCGGIEEMLALGASRRRELGTLGRERVRERYELGAVAARYAALFEELAEVPACAV